MKQPLYRYMATVNKVIDGDTINLTIDTGFRHTWTSNARMAEINAPEKTSLDDKIREKAMASMEYLQKRLPVGTEVYIISRRLDKYGRPLVSIYVGEKCINDEMVVKGFAVVYK